MDEEKKKQIQDKIVESLKEEQELENLEDNDHQWGC